MLEPINITLLINSMVRKASNTDISVKCRIGVSPERDEFNDLVEFVHAVRAGEVRHIILHARNCILRGLSPAQNRTIPPLQYNVVHEIVSLFPDMKFTINGGIHTFQQAKHHLGWISQSHFADEENISGSAITMNSSGSSSNTMNSSSNSSSISSSNSSSNGVSSSDISNSVGYRKNGLNNLPVHSVMIGREAYRNPFLFATADSEFFSYDTNIAGQNNHFTDSSSVIPISMPSENNEIIGDNDRSERFYCYKGMLDNRREIIQNYIHYIENCQDKNIYGSNICNIIKPLHNFFHGAPLNCPKNYKRKLDELIKRYSKTIENNRLCSSYNDCNDKDKMNNCKVGDDEKFTNLNKESPHLQSLNYFDGEMIMSKINEDYGDNTSTVTAIEEVDSPLEVIRTNDENVIKYDYLNSSNCDDKHHNTTNCILNMNDDIINDSNESCFHIEGEIISSRIPKNIEELIWYSIEDTIPEEFLLRDIRI